MGIALFIGFLLFIFYITRGGSAAFGKGVGTLMGCSFLGFIVLGCGTLIVLLLIPLITSVFFPLLLLGGCFYITARFLRYCNKK